MAKKKNRNDIFKDIFSAPRCYSPDDPQVKKWERERIKGDKAGTNIYFIKNGKKQMSDYDFMNKTGSIARLKATGITINPTHNFELLKRTRQELLEKAKPIFLEQRRIDNLETTAFEMNCFYISWLKGELKAIEQWLSDKYTEGTEKMLGKPNTSNQIELLKYKSYVDDEMKKTERAINQNSKKHTGIILTYQWDIAKFKCLTQLFNKIKCLLDDTVQLQDFKNIFSGKTISEITTPVKWHDGNASEVLYFIIQLQEKQFIPQEKSMNYERLKKCFVKNDGSPFSVSLKNLVTKISGKRDVFSLHKEKRKFIDIALKYLS